MPERITVVVSHAAKANATQRDFAEKIIADLLTQDSVDLTLIEEISSLAQETTGLLCLEGIRGSVVSTTSTWGSLATTSRQSRFLERTVIWDPARANSGTRRVVSWLHP